MDWNNILKVVEATITGVGLQVLGAIVLYVIGRWLISFAIGLVQKGLSRQKIEPTLLRFIGNTISVVLNITLVIAILGYFGVQTTSFAALLAGAGLAIGSAWGGLLANFAAGVFLVVLRPFKVGRLHLQPAASQVPLKRSASSSLRSIHPITSARSSATTSSFQITSKTSPPTPIGVWISRLRSPALRIPRS